MRISRIIFLLCLVAAPRFSHASALLKPTSGATQALTAKSLDVETRLSGAFAQTTITTIYANPNTSRIEADFIYSAPPGSVVTGFAYWFGEEKVVARVVEKKRAAKIYQFITERMRDPALIEMIGKNLFRAKIFPVEARADLKIEIQLAQTLSATKTGQVWNYPLQDEMRSAPSLQNVHLRAILADKNARVASSLGAFQNGILDWKATNFRTASPWKLQISQNPSPLRASLVGARDGGENGFFALALTPNRDVLRPKIQISGLKTYDVFFSPQPLKAGRNFLVFGRYRGGGRAQVSFDGAKTQLDFPDVREAKNVAAQLWASEKIERLSNSERNRAAVMSLSKRFGVPSKWTSWLAIPTEERRNFKKQMIAADRESAAREYASAVARGEKAQAEKQQRIVADLTAQLSETEGYLANHHLKPLSEFLDEESALAQKELVEARLSAPRQVAAIQKRIANLQKAGVKPSVAANVDEGELLLEEMRVNARERVKEAEANRENGPRMRKLVARARQIMATEFGKSYGLTETTYANDFAAKRAEDLAMQIALNRVAPKPNRNLEAQLLAKLTRISRVGDTDYKYSLQSATYKVWNRKINAVAAKLADEISLQRENGRRAQNLRRQLAGLEKRAGRAGQGNDLVAQAWRNRADSAARRLVFDEELLSKPQKIGLESQLEIAAQNLKTVPPELLKAARGEKIRDQFSAATDKLVDEILAGRENSPTARALQKKVEIWSTQSNDWWQRNAAQRAYNGRAHQLAYELEAELAKPNPDAVRAKQLEQSLERVAPLGGTSAENFRAAERYGARANPNGKFDVERYRWRVAGLNPSDFNRGYGGGDPLLTIEAPKDADVVALFPDGTVKKLEYVAARKRFEANFDIPTGTAGGDYFVSILIVEKSGKRRTLKMRFRVDDLAPDGKIELQSAPDGTLNLEIGAGSDVTRVTAFLPWGERLDLRRGADSLFAAKIAVPAGFDLKTAKVRFVLLDSAHNRTEMMVDWK
ncbi:MAG TPA: VIT domain-containing protein [Abditibacterium sp.]|jgi:hypothetical protein